MNSSTSFGTKVLSSGNLLKTKNRKSNTHFTDDQKARAIYNFKDRKEKLCRTNEAINVCVEIKVLCF